VGRTNFAPTARTIIVAMVLIIAGLVATSGRFVEPFWGIAAYVAAELLLLLGCATRRL
jgi:hypothetical protein